MMKVEEIDALLGGEAQRLSDQYREVPLDFMDGYGWAVTQICRLFRDAVPVIRCKDCKFVGTDATCCLVCNREGMGLRPFHVYPDDYCSYAERKEE